MKAVRGKPRGGVVGSGLTRRTVGAQSLRQEQASGLEEWLDGRKERKDSVVGQGWVGLWFYSEGGGSPWKVLSGGLMASHPHPDRWGRGRGQGAHGAHSASPRREEAVGGLGQGGGSGRRSEFRVCADHLDMRRDGEEVRVLLE